MAKLHQETAAIYMIGGRSVAIDLCWKGKEPEDDADRFYDIYDNKDGTHLNEGEPWHDDGCGIPSEIEVREALLGWLGEKNPIVIQWFQACARLLSGDELQALEVFDE